MIANKFALSILCPAGSTNHTRFLGFAEAHLTFCALVSSLHSQPINHFQDSCSRRIWTSYDRFRARLDATGSAYAVSCGSSLFEHISSWRSLNDQHSSLLEILHSNQNITRTASISRTLEAHSIDLTHYLLP